MSSAKELVSLKVWGGAAGTWPVRGGAALEACGLHPSRGARACLGLLVGHLSLGQGLTVP